MSELKKVFTRLRDKKQKALISFFTCGFPSGGLFKELVEAAADSGADIIEIGIPFSDPLADGPSIQYSSSVALGNGMNVKRTLELIASLKAKIDLPLVALTYVNPVYQYGVEKFIREAKQSGLSGLIVADLVTEESMQIENLCRSRSLDLVYLAAPTTNGQRLEQIAQRSRGFIYLVSVTGVTGVRQQIPVSIADKINQIKRLTGKPVCVGFGISNPAQARRIAELADGVIVGSALVKLIRENRKRSQILKKVSSFLGSLKKAMEV
jgi:tryptophan synthase alpha chain